ncbi:MAG: DUF3575 domain-containing protein [Bdellovibrionales bacterium]|nr:DUF3575 domain-containing protein [Bdellovibrionales bacterium]
MVLSRLLVVFSILSGMFASNANAAMTEKSVNVRVAPLALLVNYLNVDVDFPVNADWSIGPTVTYRSFSESYAGFSSNISTSVLGLGARATWFENGVFQQGWYVSPIAQYISASAKSGSASASVGVFGLTAVGGYHWFWDNFNLNLGAGFSAVLGGSRIKVTDSTTTTSTEVNMQSSGGLAIDFMIAYLF